ncbi:MAG TPA: LuxR C-terminal-related transcriptional regulator [Humibacter sp.]|nr:LuxR C-terminal-related transcriptional regulator [Humibacter sp.]
MTAQEENEAIACAGADIAEAFLALDAADPGAYEAAVSRISAASDQHDLWAFVAYLRAQHGLRTGKPLRALAALNRTVQTRSIPGTTKGRDHPLILRARAELLIASNRAHLVRELLRHGDHPTLVVPRARMLCLSGRPERAAHLIETMRGDGSMSERDQLDLLIINVSVASRLGDPRGAAELLTDVRELATRIGVTEPLVALPALDRVALGLDIATVVAYPDHIRVIELTRREEELLNILVLTDSRKQAAERLFVSMNTVKTQIAGLYRKLDARTRAEALSSARALGLLPETVSRI